MNWFMDTLGLLPDAIILVFGAAILALIALAVAAAAHRALFMPGRQILETHGKLAELVHGSLLAFTVFVLAIVLNDVRANLGRADDANLREAATIAQLDRELELAGGADSVAARNALRDYVNVITSVEWPELGASTPVLSPQAEPLLTTLNRETRIIAKGAPDSAIPLRTLVDRLVDFRQGRLESATKSVPRVFWWAVAVFLFGAMVLNGRHPFDRASAMLITLHMGALGLVIAMILVMDEPFRGQTSISPAPISLALKASSM
jgi:hypothetical protein